MFDYGISGTSASIHLAFTSHLCVLGVSWRKLELNSVSQIYKGLFF